MDYDVFKEVVKESIKDYMPDKSAHYSVDIKPVQKVNGTLDGLYMQVGEPGKEGMAVAPVLYLQELYKNYQSTGDLKGTLEVAAMHLSDGLEYSQGFTGIAFSGPEAKLVLSLINTEQGAFAGCTKPSVPGFIHCLPLCYWHGQGQGVFCSGNWQDNGKHEAFQGAVIPDGGGKYKKDDATTSGRYGRYFKKDVYGRWDARKRSRYHVWGNAGQDSDVCSYKQLPDKRGCFHGI